MKISVEGPKPPEEHPTTTKSVLDGDKQGDEDREDLGGDTRRLHGSDP